MAGTFAIQRLHDPGCKTPTIDSEAPNRFEFRGVAERSDTKRDQLSQGNAGMSDSDNEIVRGAINETIENQMRDGTPPETRHTYDRLIAAGHSREETMKLIGCVVTAEIFDVLQQNKPYNEQRYVAALKTLPKLPQERDER